MILFLQCSFFYGDRGTVSFDPLEIVSDYSNIYQNLCLVRTFDKNIPRILQKIFFYVFFNILSIVRGPFTQI